MSSDCDEEDDEPEEFDEQEESEECLLGQRILDGHEMELHEMETISDSLRLRDIYNHRWWNLDVDAYFTMYNYTRKPLAAD